MKGGMCTPLAAAVLSAACAAGDATTTTTRADSSGVTLVTNVGPDVHVPLTLHLEGRLGGRPSGPESFYRLYSRYVTVGPDGTIGVVSPEAHHAATFGPDGSVLGTYGREGEGPGEFRYPSSIALPPNGDVLVFDYEKSALVGFAADGTVLDERRLTVPFHGTDMVATRDGLVLLSEVRPRGDGTTTRRILHLSATDTVQLGPVVESTTAHVHYESCGVSMSQPPLFASDLIWASDGARTVVAATAEYSVQVFADTTLSFVVRRDFEPEAVTEAVARREVGEGEVWSVGGRECLVPSGEVIEQRGYGSVVPVIEQLALAPSGEIWVRRRRAGGAERSLDVFDRQGSYVGSVTPAPPFPVGFLPDGRYLAIETDSLDVQTLAIYSAEIAGT